MVGRRLCQWGAVLLLGVFFALALSSAVVKSASMDEGGHLALGYAYLKALDLRFHKTNHHPPLAGAWAALPLMLDYRAPALPEVPGWDTPKDFFVYVSQFYYRNPDIIRYTLVGRVQVVLLGVLLGAFVFRWAKEWFGHRAGLLACFLYALSPNILAHTRLITTDVPAALTCFVTLYMLQRLLRHPSAWRAGLTGLALGGALLVKYSTLLLVPTIGTLLFLAAWWRSWSWAMWPGLGRKKALPRSLGIAVIIFALAFLAVWAAYGFEVRLLKRVDSPLPVPAATYIDDVVHFWKAYRGGRPAFLLGHRWARGRWYYFLATLLFKTPPPALFAFVAASVVASLRHRLGKLLPLWLFPSAYFVNSLTSRFNIGHRHLLMVLPFGFVFVSQIIPMVYDRLKTRWTGVCGAFLAAWYLGASLWIYPHYLAYFNLFAGGPSQGYKVLVDSNLDWGQDLVQLRRYMEEDGLDEVWLSLFSLTDPALYGVRYRKLPDWDNKEIGPDFHHLNPDPGVYVVSATLLHGLYLPNLSTFDWFLRRDPVDQIGYSMLVYRVEEDPLPPTWVGVCYAPEPTLPPEEIAAGFGRTDLRLVYFDCRSSWVIPGEGPPGWYIIPTLAQGADGFSGDWLRDAVLEFVQYNFEGGQDFTVYRHAGTPAALGDRASPVWVISNGARAGQEIDRAPRLSPPVDMDGPATFLGYEMDSEAIAPGDVLTVRTFWKASQTVTETMPSVLLHLVDASGRTWSVGDALGFPAVQWQDGDVFVQQHTLELPLDVPRGTYWIASGMYDVVTGVRYPVQGSETHADTFWFGPVMVERDS